ncbi:hypothetical protein POVWA1_020840 [Plasmodium ovale wallikeri]|uniref:Uncharacterized protein n=1 Tax=Plasmodium ovale wallikeri TaxID=864142 RepID=A0A1A8YRP0_PLAOA|nr:hypothetical protein POVWA1_020840 [Plasmodium ovale wallikeri]
MHSRVCACDTANTGKHVSLRVWLNANVRTYPRVHVHTCTHIVGLNARLVSAPQDSQHACQSKYERAKGAQKRFSTVYTSRFLYDYSRV